MGERESPLLLRGYLGIQGVDLSQDISEMSDWEAGEVRRKS